MANFIRNRNIFLFLFHNITGDNMQKIKCDVYDCAHCNCDDKICKLHEIMISNCENAPKKEATMCDSYKKRK